jgi:hypothetical protein
MKKVLPLSCTKNGCPQRLLLSNKKIPGYISALMASCVLMSACRTILYPEFRQDYYKLSKGNVYILDTDLTRDSILHLYNDTTRERIQCLCITAHKGFIAKKKLNAIALDLTAVGHTMKLFKENPDGPSIEKIEKINFYLITKNSRLPINNLINDTIVDFKNIIWLDSSGRPMTDILQQDYVFYTSMIAGSPCTRHENISGVNDFISKFNANFDGTLTWNWFSRYKFIFFFKTGIEQLSTVDFEYIEVDIILKGPYKKRRSLHMTSYHK